MRHYWQFSPTVCALRACSHKQLCPFSQLVADVKYNSTFKTESWPVFFLSILKSSNNDNSFKLSLIRSSHFGLDFLMVKNVLSACRQQAGPKLVSNYHHCFWPAKQLLLFLGLGISFKLENIAWLQKEVWILHLNPHFLKLLCTKFNSILRAERANI